MGKTQPGIDRLMRQSLVSSLALAKRVQASHDKACLQCARAGKDLYARCTTWWNYARAIHKGERTLRQWDTDRIANQPMLPGMEDL